MKMEIGVADGARTHDNRNHNPGLYQLSYSHRMAQIIARQMSTERVIGRWTPRLDAAPLS